MAITKTAKNLKIEIRNTYTSLTGKKFQEGSAKVEIIATKENLTLISNKKINVRGNKS
ncbi:hypothetical protein [Flavobacterium gelatinilyticum]|uniref:hypothetical protein n=1 Tax=Flavobacterium gelatinilyticum TaxID=3003260 RepID=UPI002480C34C|nr:hypothetical protein [Flavobacterium gelatinilyticum]